MTLSFDEIHTEDKQKNLSTMMEKTCREVLKIENTNELHTSCPLCGGPEIDSNWTSAYGFNMSRCITCELIFCNPYPCDEQLLFYYNSEMKSFENKFFRESFEKRVELFLPRIEIIQSYVRKGNILDVGSAIGVFCEALKRSATSLNLTCCELNTEACDELQYNYPEFTVVNNNIFDFEADQKYDAITLWDTIEHIVDGETLLTKLRELLSDTGYLFFSTPNTLSFEWLCAEKKHVQILPPGHVNLYGRDNIALLLEQTGMEVVDILTLNGSLDISYVKKQLENGLLTDLDTGRFLKKAVNDTVFCEILTDYLKKQQMAGNMLVVAKKKES